MSLAGPSATERIVRLAILGSTLAPFPWLNSIVSIVKEIHDIVERIKMVRPQCKRLADEAEQIARQLDEHGKAHKGNSKLQEMIEALYFILRHIRDDLLHWASFKWYMRYYRHREILDEIDKHRARLSDTCSVLAVRGTLFLDVDSAQKEEEIQEIKAEMEELKVKIEDESRRTVQVKQEWKDAQMIGIEEIEEAEERIFSLRLDPENFPDADMQGEVTKMDIEAYRIGDTFDVFKAAWLGRRLVAAKRFRGRDYGMTEKQERRFTRQMNIWRSLKHPNVVPVLGICKFEDHRPPYLISPWMKYGNVRDYLNDFGEGADKLKLIHEVALGLQYIHSVGVLHGNLNPTNVLVNINHCVRLTGFSISKKLQSDAKYTCSNGNQEIFRWWSPETIWKQVLSEQSDVWSWAMTALEILSGERPYKHLRSPLEVMQAVGEEEEQPDPSDYENVIASDEIWTLMKDCWKPYGTRPDIGQVVAIVRRERIRNGWNPDDPPPEPQFDRDFPEAF